MGYVIGAIAGIIYGGLICVIKYLSLWRPYLHSKKDGPDKSSSIYVRLIASWMINLAALLILYLARNAIPEQMDWIALIIAAALAISVGGKFYSADKVNRW